MGSPRATGSRCPRPRPGRPARRCPGKPRAGSPLDASLRRTGQYARRRLPGSLEHCRISRMSTPYPRDLVGYAGRPPHPHWPGDARIAVNFVVNYEEGSEYNVHDDGVSEGTLTESGSANYGGKGRDLAAEGMFEYGSRVGCWRVLRLFKERGLPLTVFGCALALERNPAAGAGMQEVRLHVGS